MRQPSPPPATLNHPLLVVAVAAACACTPQRSPSPSDTTVVVESPASAASPSDLVSVPPDGVTANCPADLPMHRAEQDYQTGLRAMKEAGEHPTARNFERVLEPLHRAAHAGHMAAQKRYGDYVLGYWATDEMFWPSDRETAVAALAMLRVWHRRNPDAVDEAFAGLARDPVDRQKEPLSYLSEEWIDLAVEAANAWERCHPGLATPGAMNE